MTMNAKFRVETFEACEVMDILYQQELYMELKKDRPENMSEVE